jgi:hypothetical protein
MLARTAHGDEFVVRHEPNVAFLIAMPGMKPSGQTAHVGIQAHPSIAEREVQIFCGFSGQPSSEKNEQ